MKRYLVTGAAGFIGANFLKYLLKKYGEDICGRFGQTYVCRKSGNY